jgi:hypothetical protein
MWVADLCFKLICGGDFREARDEVGGIMFDPLRLEINLVCAKFGEGHADYFPAARLVLRQALAELQKCPDALVPAPCTDPIEAGCRLRRLYLIDYMVWVLAALDEPQTDGPSNGPPRELCTPTMDPWAGEALARLHAGQLIAPLICSEDEIFENLDNDRWLIETFAVAVDAVESAVQADDLDAAAQSRKCERQLTHGLLLHVVERPEVITPLLSRPYTREVRLAAALLLLETPHFQTGIDALEQLQDIPDHVSQEAKRTIEFKNGHHRHRIP